MSLKEIYLITLISVNVRLFKANPQPVPQLNLPPLGQSAVSGGGRPTVTPNSYSGDDDGSDELTDDKTMAGRSSDYDRDRSQRFGPPYNDDNGDQYYARNRSVFSGRDQFGNQYNGKDDDKYYADRRPDIMNGNLDFNRNGKGGNRYYNNRNNNEGGYQRVSFKNRTACYEDKTINC